MFKTSAGELAGDALRFVLLHEIPSFADGDMTMETIKASYTAHLANGIGNLTSRIMKMAITYGISPVGEIMGTNNFLEEAFSDFDSKKVLSMITTQLSNLDKEIQDKKPFELYKTDPEKAREIVMRYEL